MAVIAFCRKPGVDPILFTFRIIPHVRLSHRHQFTGSVFRGVSSGTGAVNDNLRILVRQEIRCLGRNFVGRQIYRPGQTRVIISGFGQCLDENEIIFAGDLLLQLVSGIVKYWNNSFLQMMRKILTCIYRSDGTFLERILANTNRAGE